jgi:two-component system response regulator DesR
MIRVLLADDENVVRSALAQLLELEPDLTVVAQAADADGAVEAARATSPDVTVLDLQMPGRGLAALAALRDGDEPLCECLVLTSHGRPGHLRRALEAGAAGFLPKTASAADLAAAVRRVAGGGRYVDPELAAEAIVAGDSPLTAREVDVLTAAAGGAPVETIAHDLHLSVGTVRNYLSSASTKLDVANRHEAAARARRLGWI